MSDNSALELLREATKRPSYKQTIYVNAGQLLEEIEREYLPRPRYEDGELVREGDTICIDGELPLKVYWYSVRSDGLTVFSCPTSSRQIKTGERVKRPEPEVLDADGVPIRVGDTVWAVGQHVVKGPLNVTAVEPGVVSYETDDGRHGMYFTIGDITHKEHDSLERIEADAKLDVCDYYEGRDDHKCDGCHGAYCFECKHEMTLDLLRRQREVLERVR